jgi:hypothetical protein
MNSSGSFYQKTKTVDRSLVTLSALVLCVSSVCLVLIHATEDQSGTKLSQITKSFRAAMKGTTLEFTPTVKSDSAKSDSANAPVAVTSGDSTGVRLAQNLIQRRNRLARVSQTTEVDPDRLVDKDGAAFDNLLSEISRYCPVSNATDIDGEIAIDLFSADLSTDEQVVPFAVQAIQQTRKNASFGDWEFEIVCWATTPAASSLRDAVLKAAQIQTAVDQKCVSENAAVSQMTSSGRIWTSPSEVRPMATLLIRRTGGLKVSPRIRL